MDAKIKADLLAIGNMDVDESLLARISSSSAGPGTGLKSIFFRSGGHRVRLEINKDSPLKMLKANGDFVILKEGKELVRGELEQILAHCPQQAYITLSERCVYDCKFCSVPKLPGKIKSLEEVIALVETARRTGGLKAIALTSGIAHSPEEEIDRVVEVVKALRKYNLPIGVSVHPTKDSSQRLKDAGAVEVKYNNVETMDRAIFERVCRGRKGLSLDFILNALRDAVRVFGKNRVFTNIIIGLGETDEGLREGVEYLAKIGVIPVLRPITIPPLRKDELVATRPSAERLLKLTKMTREILDRYGLRVDVSETMCLPCTGCDLTPYRDV
ncbi:MAG: radical SAM protein [Methanophagales archaeon ANME-1-THS]|nr:MAG: radical SAM protein [Methanophagales archaeon ANME-1-THS]